MKTLQERLEDAASHYNFDRKKLRKNWGLSDEELWETLKGRAREIYLHVFENDANVSVPDMRTYCTSNISVTGTQSVGDNTLTVPMALGQDAAPTTCQHPHEALRSVGCAIHSVRHAPDECGVTVDPYWFPVYWCSRCGAVAPGSQAITGPVAVELPGSQLLNKPVADPEKLPKSGQWLLPAKG